MFLLVSVVIGFIGWRQYSQKSVPFTNSTNNDGGGPVWLSVPFRSHTGQFTAEIDAVPLRTTINAGIALSSGTNSSFTDLACIARFHSTGIIDARDGNRYRSESSITYIANATYHFRFFVNIPSHTYSVYVKAPGGPERVIGTNMSFRSERAETRSLSSWSIFGDTGSVQISGLMPADLAQIGEPEKPYINTERSNQHHRQRMNSMALISGRDRRFDQLNRFDALR
jgi:hypothetical protein